jgi:hypothetical protein
VKWCSNGFYPKEERLEAKGSQTSGYANAGRCNEYLTFIKNEISKEW